VLTVSQTYEGTLDDLWDACTNPKRIPRWFLPVSGDLRVGGRYQLEGNASGTIERCDPPNSFAGARVLTRALVDAAAGGLAAGRRSPASLDRARLRPRRRV
jgi:hypothetical protein